MNLNTLTNRSASYLSNVIPLSVRKMTDLMEDHFTYDFIVVGAGIEGSATALNIVEKALNSSVAMLEQVCTSVASY